MMYGTKFCFNKKWAWFDCVNLSFSCIHAYWLLHLSLHSSLEIRKVIIEIKEKDRALWHLYRTCARTRIMSEIEEEQEQMKADMEAMKKQMTMMMEATMDMRKIMGASIATVVAASTATERDPAHPPSFNQESHLVTDMEGQGGVTGVATYGPQYTQSHTFPPYSLPPNYTPSMAVPVPAINVTNPTPICTENNPAQPNQT